MIDFENIKIGTLLKEEQRCHYSREEVYEKPHYYIVLSIDISDLAITAFELYSISNKEIIPWSFDMSKILHLNEKKEYSDKYFRISILC